MIGNYLLDCLKEIESKRNDIVIEGVVFYEVGDTPLNEVDRYYRDQIYNNEYRMYKLPFCFYCRNEEEERMFIRYGKGDKTYLVKESTLINNSLKLIKRFKERDKPMSQDLLDKLSKKSNKRRKYGKN